MRVPIGRRRRVARGPALVLLYHRVARLDLDPWSLAVAPESFEAHLDVLRTRCRVVPLDELQADLAQGTLRPGTVAITFDDGYADMLHTARPLLERYELPATVFVTAGAITSDREFWWDELERIVLVPEQLPDVLELAADGGAVRRRVGSAPDARASLHRELWTTLRPLETAVRDRSLAELRAWAGVPERARPTHRPLNADELRRLTADSLVRVGAHTVGHPLLAALTPAAQADELGGSRAALETLTDYAVRHLSYPFGGADAYSDVTVALARDAGFELACTNRAAAVTRATPPLELPRLYVHDLPREPFSDLLAQWLEER